MSATSTPPSSDDTLLEADAGEVIQQLADPEDESLLSAALLVQDRLGLNAETSDGDLPQVAARLDQLLREDLQLTSQDTVAVVRRLRDVLLVHDIAGGVPLGRPGEDAALVMGLATAIRDDAGTPVAELTDVEVEDVVRRTIGDARAEAIAEAVAAAVAADRAITAAQAAHDAEMRELVRVRRERIEAAIAAGRGITELGGDLQLSRQRLHQIRHGVR